MAVLKTVKLICTNIDANNNKFWDAELHDDGMVHITYGRVGYSGTKEVKAGGQKFLDSKIKEKKKKGYTEFQGIDVPQSGQGAIANSSTLSKETIKEVAKKQINFNNPQLEKLIERLAASNVHNIVQNTKIQYDVKTGLFSTPRGILTPQMITDARNLLAKIKFLTTSKDQTGLKESAEQYLMLVPKAIGMGKFSVEKLFPDQKSFDDESNILDSLEASYATFNTSTKVVSESNNTIVEEKIFNVSLDILQDQKEYDDLVHWYESSKKKVHGYGNIKVANIYKISISDMNEAFMKKGEKYGNIEKVFHGTSEANLLSILKSGLKVSPPSTAFIAGKMFGNGVYGAKESSKALGYTLGRWGNQRASSGWLFVCDFAMGKTYSPTHTGHPPSGYDSTWARSKQCGLMHDELIVYKNEQIRINYLLEVK